MGCCDIYIYGLYTDDGKEKMETTTKGYIGYIWGLIAFKVTGPFLVMDCMAAPNV